MDLDRIKHAKLSHTHTHTKNRETAGPKQSNCKDQKRQSERRANRERWCASKISIGIAHLGHPLLAPNLFGGRPRVALAFQFARVQFARLFQLALHSCLVGFGRVGGGLAARAAVPGCNVRMQREKK